MEKLQFQKIITFSSKDLFFSKYRIYFYNKKYLNGKNNYFFICLENVVKTMIYYFIKKDLQIWFRGSKYVINHHFYPDNVYYIRDGTQGPESNNSSDFAHSSSYLYQSVVILFSNRILQYNLTFIIWKTAERKRFVMSMYICIFIWKSLNQVELHCSMSSEHVGIHVGIRV